MNGESEAFDTGNIHRPPKDLPPVRDHYLPFGRPNFSDQEIQSVAAVLRSGWVGMGPETIAFERELAAATGARHVVTVNSCTSALFLSLLVSGVGPGDEVICQSLTWCSTANAALYLDATPVFCDVDRETLCVTPETVLAKVTARTKAVIVVHYAGLAMDVGALRAALPGRITIIEDAAHAFGARFADGAPVGSSGNLTCFSFYANKNLSSGEGGAIALADDAGAQRLRSLRLHGLPVDAWERFTRPQALHKSQQPTELGYKLNYTDLQAALGRVQLTRQREFHGTRLAVAKCYAEALQALPIPVRLQRDCLHPHHARHLFIMMLPLEGTPLDRDELVWALRTRNIGASVHYPPLHLMPLYRRGDASDSLPVTEQVARSVLTLPISASMNERDAGYVTAHLQAVMTDIGQRGVRTQSLT